MAIGTADRVDVSVAELFGNDDQRRAVLDKLASIGVAQAMETEILRQFSVKDSAFEAWTMVGVPLPAVFSHE